MARIIAKICIRRKCTSQTIHEFFVKPAKRAFSCTAKAVFVSRASDADRRSRRRGDAARRSLLPKRQRSVRGLLTRPSSHGVDASAKAALAARQMRRGSWSRVSASRRHLPFGSAAPPGQNSLSRVSALVSPCAYESIGKKIPHAKGFVV